MTADEHRIKRGGNKVSLVDQLSEENDALRFKINELEETVAELLVKVKELEDNKGSM